MCETGRRGQIGEFTAIIRMRENTKDIDRERLRNRDIDRDRQKNRQRRQNQELPKLKSKGEGSGSAMRYPLRIREREGLKDRELPKERKMGVKRAQSYVGQGKRSRK